MEIKTKLNRETAKIIKKPCIVDIRQDAETIELVKKEYSSVSIWRYNRCRWDIIRLDNTYKGGGI